ncbi:MAG: neutral zinc metallopeptidase [Verrucomicrobiales bacterium]
MISQPGPVQAQDDEPSGVDGNTYTSPTFGYSFRWDDDTWSLADEISDSGYDFLYLQAGYSDLSVEGLYIYQGDPDDCLDGERIGIAGENGLEDLVPTTDQDGNEVVDSGDGFAYGLYELPGSDEPGADLVNYLYIECQVLVPGAAVLIVLSYLDPEDLDNQADLVYEVLSTLEMGSAEEITFDSAELEQEIRLAGIDINTYWKDRFAAFGETYNNPKFITFTGPIETECGDAMAGESGPFYCPSDQTVYLDIEELTAEILPYGTIVVKIVIAHEIGHHVQELLGLTGCDQTECGVDGSSLAIELQADCMAGAWTGDAATRDFIEPSDLKRVDEAIKEYLGDPPGTAADDPDAHGSGETRLELYAEGFAEGLPACGIR